MNADGLRVIVGGSLEFVGVPEMPNFVERGTFVIERGGFQGWEDGVDIRQDVVEYVGADGSYDLEPTLGSRSVTVSGYAVAADARQLQQLRHRFVATAAKRDRMVVQVTIGGETLWGRARISGKPKFVDAGIRQGLAYAEFQLALWFADPRKFGPRQDLGPSGSLQVSHRGNFRAAPHYEIRGASESGYTLTVGGNRVVVTERLLSWQIHRIDPRTNRLTVGGDPVYGQVSVSESVFVEPFRQVTVSVSNGANVTVPIYDTYI